MKDLVKNAGLLPEVDKFAISDFVANVLVPIVGAHPYPLDEMMLMVSAVALAKPKYIFEWGTHIGKSARIFHETVKFLELPCEIHSIDLPDDVEHNEHPKEHHAEFVKGISEVQLHRGDGIIKALELCNGKSKDDSFLFFVDGDHSYNSVKRELELIFKNIPLATVLIHDTFYQADKSGYNVSPCQAVLNSVTGERNILDVFLITTNLGLPGMALICKK